jgi:hypothetical protein
LLEGFARAAESEEALGIEVWEYEDENVEGEVGDGADVIGHVGAAIASRTFYGEWSLYERCVQDRVGIGG